MFARVTITQGPPEGVEKVVGYIKEHIIPAARKEPGFRGGNWLGDRKTGRGMVVTLWESEEAERASQAMAAQTRAHASADECVNVLFLRRPALEGIFRPPADGIQLLLTMPSFPRNGSHQNSFSVILLDASAPQETF
jgi:heme-degrading monooxygenase HmoA